LTENNKKISTTVTFEPGGVFSVLHDTVVNCLTGVPIQKEHKVQRILYYSTIQLSKIKKTKPVKYKRTLLKH